MINPNDIVVQLRAVFHNDRGVELLDREAADEIERLRECVRDLEEKIGSASMLLADWDGYYNPEKGTGNTIELAGLIEDAYKILQGSSWRSIDKEEADYNNEMFRRTDGE